MTNTEYERLQKAQRIQDDLSLLRNAVFVLTSLKFRGGKKLSPEDSKVIETAMQNFINNDDLIDLFNRKIESLEAKFKEL